MTIEQIQTNKTCEIHVLLCFHFGYDRWFMYKFSFFCIFFF